MFKNINDIWILFNTGELIYHYSDKNMDPTLFGAILAAINTYSENIAEGGVYGFEFKENRLSFYKKHDIMFVALASLKKSSKKVKKGLEAISEKFFNLYSVDYIKNWQGKMDHFSEFKRILESFH